MTSAAKVQPERWYSSGKTGRNAGTAASKARKCQPNTANALGVGARSAWTEKISNTTAKSAPGYAARLRAWLTAGDDGSAGLAGGSTGASALFRLRDMTCQVGPELVQAGHGIEVDDVRLQVRAQLRVAAAGGEDAVGEDAHAAFAAEREQHGEVRDG